jgi:Flp pilus assembly protein TadG
LAAQLNTTAGAAVTVNVAEQVVVNGAQELVYVQVTVVVPPQTEGATGDKGLVDNTPLHPPLAVVEAIQVAKAVLMAACVWQAGSVRFVAQVNMTAGAAVTVNVAEQVVVNGAQELVYVQVTVVLPPHANGAPVLLLVNTALHPPVNVVVVNHVAKAVLIAACVWQAGSV